MIKKIILLLGIILFFSISTFAKIHKTVMIIDLIEYHMFTDGKRNIKQKYLLNFHSVFMKSLYTVCNELHVKIPSRVRVNITGYAWIFTSLTGFDASIAGLFDRKFEQFYFQNPKSLLHKGIAATIIKHEMLHFIIYNNRNHKFKRNIDILWLEESFCESIYPSQRSYGVHVHTALKKINSPMNLKNYLNKDLKSPKIILRKKAYAIAQQWGIFLQKKLGRKIFFLIITNKIHERKTYKYFKEFKRKYN